MVVNFDTAQRMRVHDGQVAGESNIEMAHVRNAEASQMIRNVAGTGTVIIQSAAKILLARNAWHLAQVFREVKTHACRIFKFIKLNRTIDNPLFRFAATNNRARPKICHIRTERHHHIHQVGNILQIHKDTVKALFLEHKRCTLRINRNLKTTARISLPNPLTGLVSDTDILDGQIRFRFKNDTNNHRRRSSEDSYDKKQDKAKNNAKIHALKIDNLSTEDFNKSQTSVILYACLEFI